MDLTVIIMDVSLRLFILCIEFVMLIGHCVSYSMCYNYYN